MIRRNFFKLSAMSLSAGAVGLAACSGPDENTNGTGGEGGGEVVMGLIEPLVSFDPAVADWGNLLPYYQTVYDTLLLATPEGEIEPYLATDWKYDEAETTLTLTIRDGVTFSDGEKLDAAAVALSMKRFKDGNGPNAGHMNSVEEIEASDASTVRVTFTQPDPAFLDYLTRGAGLVLSPAAVENEDLPTNPVGSGPYILDVANTVSQSTYTFVKRDGYWNPDVQHYDKIVLRVIEDPTAILNALRAGELDLAKLSAAETFEQAEAAGCTLNKNELDFQGLLLLDRGGETVPELGDVRVRQAINHAIDRPAMLEAVALGYGTVTSQVFRATSVAYDEALDERFPYDVQKAKDLMAEAGYAEGFSIEMPSDVVFGSTVYPLMTEALGEIGITVTYTRPGNRFISDLLAPKWGAAFMALEQNPDWQLVNFMLSKDSTFNPFGYTDDTVRGILDEFPAADETGRTELIKELNAHIVEEAWFAPFFRIDGVVATGSNTKVTMLPSNTLPNIYDIVPA